MRFNSHIFVNIDIFVLYNEFSLCLHAKKLRKLIRHVQYTYICTHHASITFTFVQVVACLSLSRITRIGMSTVKLTITRIYALK